MELQRIRSFLFIALVIVSILLYGNWQKERTVHTDITRSSAQNTAVLTQASEDIPHGLLSITPALTVEKENVTSAENISITTDLLSLKINLRGGDVVYAALPAYLEKHRTNPDEPINPFVLLDQSSDRYYIAQSGLIGNRGPDSIEKGRALYKSAQTSYQLAPDADQLEVSLIWVSHESSMQVRKTYIFDRGSYAVKVRYTIENNSARPWEGALYGQIKRQSNDTGGMFSSQGYQGAAYYTADKPYQKLPFNKIEKNNLDRKETGGWVAMLERYFVTAWIPSSDTPHAYFSKTDTQHRYIIGTMDMPIRVLPGDTQYVEGQWYFGPELAAPLKALAPGLDLTVDYGFLWPISQTLVWGLKLIHQVIGNWGWAIVLLTLFLKLAFYKLSASSFRSMEKLRQLQPQITLLKEKHGEDRQRFSEEMIALYRRDKVNPLGGFLPLLIQIPVFIALYYALLESIELRHAPFILWITDLSSHDPYFVLPILMGITMLMQQRLSPPAADPMQAKMMMFMPVIFTVIGLQFPAGLTLYWVVNNILSMLQQWIVGRQTRVS